MSYTAFPLQVFNQNKATVSKCERILSEMLSHRGFFTDYTEPCEETCGDCGRCLAVKRAIVKNLVDDEILVWEVWKLDEGGDLVDIVGILRLSRIDPGCDATAHYFFFDHKLSDKTDLLKWWRDWAFSDHDDIGWIGLERVTIEVPSFAFALASHAVRRLGFGGDFSYEAGGRTWPVEGVKRRAKILDGEWFDLLILGLHRESDDRSDKRG